MRKLTILFSLLTLSVGLWAEEPANAEYVDLGLPSGIKWAACNIGATNPEEYGDYFSWGETESKDDYSWDKYTYKDNHPDVLPADHDAARLNLGGHWRMPTLDDFEELRNNCKCSYTTNYNNTGVAGCVFTRKDGNSIFFPAAGNHAGNGSNFVGERGYSWLSTLNETNSDEAYGLCFLLKPYEDMGWKVIERYYGLPIRPVYDPSMTPTPISVNYIDENGAEQTADGVNDIAPSDAIVTWGTAGQTTWYVVTGDDITLPKGAVCQGAVHLILADGAKLTTTGEGFGQTPGIQVSGDGNSLIIYGQMVQSGQIVAQGGTFAAGIGGGQNGSGSYITINGGVVTANGSYAAAGIGGGQKGSGSYITINGGVVTANGGLGAAGIGGGSESNGSHITINGGVVTANGNSAAGIGGGSENSSDIYVATNLVVKADRNNPPTEVIYNNGSDLASSLSSKIYVTIDPGSLDKVKTDAIAAINAAIEGVTDETILAIANKAKTDIEAAETVQAVISIKATALAQMNALTLAIARADAISAVQAAATDAKTAIDAASTYEEADAVKAEYKAEIDAIVSGAIYSINNATSKGAIDEELLQAKTDINLIKSEALAKIIKINELAKTKAEAVAEILAAGEGIQNTQMRQWIDAAIEDIQGVGTTTIEEVERTKGEILNALRFFKEGKAEGLEEGKAAGKAEMKAELLGSMAEPCTDCTAVEVTNGTTTVTLYNTTNVGYIKK